MEKVSLKQEGSMKLIVEKPEANRENTEKFKLLDQVIHQLQPSSNFINNFVYASKS